ncbi:MAG: sugar phosphate isomerase/epimerase [Oscillospiraceae bacterium]|jgi:sugar phosphate isomerase/epimerase|nr:sugar phosphate isomerase/epimerase [Oscillospiraceae bacterium]
MKQFPIGVLVDCFKQPMPEALASAAAVGCTGVQVYSTRGDRAPENMNAAARREFLDLVKSHGLVISALCGDLGGGGFTKPDMNPAKIEKSKRILDLAKDLETDVVTTHIGAVPADPNHPRYILLQEACGELARYADSVGAHFAIETGPEDAPTLKTFLDSLGSRGVSVNLDPANFRMVTGQNEAEAVYLLKDYIVHTHAKDGRRNYYVDPDVVYGMRPRTENDHIITGPSFEELPLGEGQVEWPAYLQALEDIGYSGFLTIERECGSQPYADIAHAVKFLQGQWA